MNTENENLKEKENEKTMIEKKLQEDMI